MVMCGNLGYYSGDLFEYRIIPSGEHKIWLELDYCNGDEGRVEYCSVRPWGNIVNCNHWFDLGVGCDPYTSFSWEIAYPGIRLVNTDGVIINSHGV